MTQLKKMPVAATTGKNGTAANGRTGQPHHTTARPKTQAPTAKLTRAMSTEAVHYATNYGWRVVPVRGKVPATPHAHLDLSLIHI